MLVRDVWSRPQQTTAEIVLELGSVHCYASCLAPKMAAIRPVAIVSFDMLICAGITATPALRSDTYACVQL